MRTPRPRRLLPGSAGTAPRRACPARRRVEPCFLIISPHGRWSDADAKAGQLTVFLRQPQPGFSCAKAKYQAADIAVDCRARAVYAGTWLPSVGEQCRDASAAPYPGSPSSPAWLAGCAGSHRAAPRSAPGPPRKASAAPWAAAEEPRAGDAAELRVLPRFLAPHSQSHATNHVTSRKTNRRHMTRDHCR